MPDFAKHYRETIAKSTEYYVAVRFMPWSQFELSNGLPFTMPTPHCTGCLMVFDDESAAKDWAGDSEILHILTRKEKPNA